jgi:D-serine deaminase-like pyridoxal phosphate-dependent protein
MLGMTIQAGQQPAASPIASQQMRAALAALRDQPIPATSKGFGRLAAAGRAPGAANPCAANPGAADGTAADGIVTSASLAERRPYLLGPDFMLPVLVLREAAMRQNIAAMAGYCAAAGVGLAPHGKTTMAPQLFARQLAAGAWGMTAATIAQVQVYRAFGVPRVLIANELADRGAIEWLAAELAADPGFECYAYVDSLAGVRLLDESLRACGARRPLPVLVELGQPAGRAGCRSVDEALAVAGAAASAGPLRLAGAAGFEGNIHGDSAAATVTAVAAFCRELRTLGDLLPADPAGTPHLLSAGGSAYFDIVAAQLTAARPGHPRPEVLIRSGAYITYDHGLYAAVGPGAGQPGRTGPALVPALELWAPVLSRPEPGLAVASAGRRDAGFDQGLPVPLRIRHADGRETSADQLRVTKLDDQHAHLSVPAGSPLAPGDLICLGISHPCTTFDKWRVIPVVDEEYRVIDAIHTFF